MVTMLHIQKVGCIIRKTSIYTFNHWIPKLLIFSLNCDFWRDACKTKAIRILSRLEISVSVQLLQIFCITVIKYAKSSRYFQQSLIFKDDPFCFTDLTNNMYAVAHLNMSLTMDLRWYRAVKTNILVIQLLMQDFYFKDIKLCIQHFPHSLLSLRR